MTLSALDNFYDKQKEPKRSVFLYLRKVILNYNQNLTAEWKYRLPFFYYKGKMCCYLWQDKVTDEPYIGFAHGVKLNHPALVQGDRKWVRIYPMPASKDIDRQEIESLLALAIEAIERKL